MSPTSATARRWIADWARRRLSLRLGRGLAVCSVALVSLQAEVRVVGSDVLGPNFTQAFLELGARARTELRVTLDGSLPARGQLVAGSADLGLLIAGPGAAGAPLPVSLHSVAWGYLAVAVVVPTGNPVAELSVPQLAAIFGSLESTSVQRWGELGLDEPLWQSRNVSFHAPAPVSGLAHDLFRHGVLQNRPLRENLTFHSTSAELIQAVASTPNAIGFVPLASADAAGVRILPIAVKRSGTAYRPEAAALHRGDYPLGLPLRLVFRRSAVEELQPLLQMLLAEEGAALVRAAGFVPLPPEVRREVARELAMLAGPQNSAAEK